MDMKLEVIVLPVSDPDAAKEFYERAGFHLDVDHQAGESFRVIQLTPPGSACSVTFGVGLGRVTTSPIQGLHLVVDDIEAAMEDLAGRGIELGPPFHFGPDGQAPGLHPDRADYGTYSAFSDPAGNGWLLQEVGHNRG